MFTRATEPSLAPPRFAAWNNGLLGMGSPEWAITSNLGRD
jgi:hypothetical protein